MTKPEIEKLIAYISDNIPIITLHDKSKDREEAVFKLEHLYAILHDYPVESDKTCGSNYQSMYEVCKKELEATKERLASVQLDMHNLSIEHAHYVGAVAAMETIFGRKFDPQR